MILVVGGGSDEVKEDGSMAAADTKSEKVAVDRKAAGRIGMRATEGDLEPNGSPRDQVTGVHKCRLRSS